MKSLAARAKNPALFLVGFLSLVWLLLAPAAADTVAHSFNAKSSIAHGSIVAISKDDGSMIELAPADDPARIYGVVIEASEASVAIENPNRKLVVATAGVYQVLVTNQNGAIGAGDLLSMSKTNGVAGRAKANQPFILGRATENFDGSQNVTGRTSDGAPIGAIKVQVSPAKNPFTKDNRAVPGALRHLSESVAGKPLSAARIYLSLSIFLVTMVMAVSLVWVGVRSGIVSIGRNPLSRYSIMQSLRQVIFASLAVFIVGMLGVYLLLRL